MSIRIQTAQLDADSNGAELYAERVDGESAFRINHWDFDAKACREASEFFNMLAAELEGNRCR